MITRVITVAQFVETAIDNCEVAKRAGENIQGYGNPGLTMCKNGIVLLQYTQVAITLNIDKSSINKNREWPCLTLDGTLKQTTVTP